MSEPQNGRGALFAGGLAAILASACCLGPLVLIALGFSGAWIGNLTVLEPYRPIFIGAALVALFFAWRRIYRPAQACKPGEVCAIPQVRATYKLIFCIVAALVLITLGFSGAWIGNLTALEPFRPIFIGAALVALFFAWKRIYRPAQACKPGEVCAMPQVRVTYKLIFWIVVVLVFVALGFPYVMPFFY